MDEKHRRLPGEAGFSLLMLAVSLALAVSAYHIPLPRQGGGALSGPGAFPLGVAGVMVISSLAIVVRTLGLQRSETTRSWRQILPWPVIFIILMMVIYGLALDMVGFLPVSFLFMAIAIKVLHRASLARAALISAGALLIIYVVFRLIFSVLMPEGIVPERDILAYLGRFLSGGK